MMCSSVNTTNASALTIQVRWTPRARLVQVARQSGSHDSCRLMGDSVWLARPVLNQFAFYLSARSPMCIRCARTSMAGQICSFLSYLRSLASRPFLHRVSQAQRLVWATNHQQLASGEPGSAEIRQPIRPLV